MTEIGNKPLNEKYSPDFITELGPKDIFVFASNLAGSIFHLESLIEEDDANMDDVYWYGDEP